MVRFFAREKLNNKDIENTNPPTPNITTKRLKGVFIRASAFMLVVASSRRINKVGTARSQSTDTCEFEATKASNKYTKR
jgi:hypothetical protein